MDPGFVLYLPATQAIQLLCTPDQPALQTQDVLSASGYEYSGHVRHCDLSLAQYKPAAHRWHVSAVDALTAPEYFPAPQSVHAMDPGFVLYFPATQAIQLPFTPVQPTLHTQELMVSFCASKYEFAGHGTHVDALT